MQSITELLIHSAQQTTIVRTEKSTTVSLALFSLYLYRRVSVYFCIVTKQIYSRKSESAKYKRKILKGHCTLSNRMSTLQTHLNQANERGIVTKRNGTHTHTYKHTRNLVTKTNLLTRRILWYF